MKEKVLAVYNHWDMTILEGVANYKGFPHYFRNLVLDNNEYDFYSNIYQLTYIESHLEKLVIDNWEYWLYFINNQSNKNLPDYWTYRKTRKNTSFDDIKITDTEILEEEWSKAEKNYKNELIINDYLEFKDCIPNQIEGFFSGKINGTDTYVEWADLETLII